LPNVEEPIEDDVLKLNVGEPSTTATLKDAYTILAEFPDKVTGVSFLITAGVLSKTKCSLKRAGFHRVGRAQEGVKFTWELPPPGPPGLGVAAPHNPPQHGGSTEGLARGGGSSARGPTLD
jgi:hypothetical protein